MTWKSGPPFLVRRVWDIKTGAPISILTGAQGDDQLRLAKQWRDAHASTNATLLAATNDGVEVSVASSQDPGSAIARVFVLPPEVLEASTIRVSSSLETMLAFTKSSNRFLAFKLNLVK